MNAKKSQHGKYPSPPRVVPLSEMRLGENAIEAAEKSAGRSLRSEAKEIRSLAEVVANLSK